MTPITIYIALSSINGKETQVYLVVDGSCSCDELLTLMVGVVYNIYNDIFVLYSTVLAVHQVNQDR